MSFGRQKAKKNFGTSPPEPPQGLCHGPARGLTAPPPPQTPSCLSRYAHTHIIWASSALFHDLIASFISILYDKIGEFPSYPTFQIILIDAHVDDCCSMTQDSLAFLWQKIRFALKGIHLQTITKNKVILKIDTTIFDGAVFKIYHKSQISVTTPIPDQVTTMVEKHFLTFSYFNTISVQHK